MSGSLLSSKGAMFNMGLTEIMVIAALALVIFGPEKLPGMARTLGKYLTEFKRTVNGVKSSIQEEIDSNIGTEMGEVKNLKNALGSGVRGRNMEDILNTAADVLEKSKPAPPGNDQNAGSPPQAESPATPSDNGKI